MDSAWTKAARIVRTEGSSSLLVRALRKLLSPVVEFGSIHFFVRDLEQTLPAVEGACGAEPRQALLSELPTLLPRPDSSQSEELFRRRFGRGDLCIAAFDADQRAVHTRWVTTGYGRIPELAMDFFPGPAAAYFYDGYTRPEARGRGVDGVIRCFIFQRLRAQGLKRVYSYVRGDNRPGLRAAQRWQQPAGRVSYVRLRGLRPRVFGLRKAGLSAFLKRAEIEEEAAAFRVLDWRQWFEGWVREPLAKRSVGFHASSEEYLVSTADYIRSTLRLECDSDVVLDLGCDSALVTRLVAPRCLRLIGADFIAGLLRDAAGQGAVCASGTPAAFVAADGRLLPFRRGAFTKAYCVGVIHTLPSHEDGLALIQELVRVCRPGGEVLVGAVPRRPRGLRSLWKQSGLVGMLRMLVARALPRPVKKLVRRLLGWPPRDRLVFLEYDLNELKARLETRGLRCEVLDFPPDYPCPNFRETRNSLLIRLPLEAAPRSEIRDLATLTA